jgi:hypothetical protein
MFYYTYHSDMVALQYEYVDVSSDLPVVCIFYYTHHSDMDVAQYVQHDVPSGDPVS